MDTRALIVVPLAALVLSVSAATPRVPDHWQVFAIAHTATPPTANGSGFDFGLDPTAEPLGTPTLTIRSNAPQLPVSPSVGTVSQPAFGYAGQRVRFTAEVRATGSASWAGVFLAPGDGNLINRLARGEPGVENQLPLGSRVAGDGRWQTVSVVMDVPAGLPQVNVGLALVGEGQLWARHLRFEVVGAQVPATSTPIGIDWAQARQAQQEGRRVMAQIPPQPLVNPGLE